jgi:hypothetical protein
MSCLVLLCFSLSNKIEIVRKNVITVLMAEYLFLLFCFTILCRNINENRTIIYLPFESYREIFCGNTSYLRENMLNIAMFLPLGFLYTCIIKIKKKLEKFCVRIYNIVVY